MKRGGIIAGGIALCVIAVSAAGYTYVRKESQAAAAGYATPQEADPYVRFDMDVYDIIQANYWQKAADSDLAPLFQAALAKAANVPSEALATSTRAAVAQMLAAQFAQATSTDAKQQLALLTAQVALYNLAPAGRSELYTSADETALRNTVANVNPAVDLYQSLGLPKGASAGDVQAAYQKTAATLAASTSPQAKADLAQATQAKDVLTNTTDKTLYDSTGMLPTVFTHVDGAHTLYIDMNKVSPATFQEFVLELTRLTDQNPALDRMIIDMRGNIGGSLDFTAAFLALWEGPDQYAFDLFHQGALLPQRTPAIAKLPELSQFREVAILTDGMTQSTAELTTEVFRHFNIAHIVGATTRGWGTVENTFPIPTTLDASTTYAVFLVHSLTVRDDGQPIEGHGVDPDVNVGDTNWETELSNYFYSSDLINAIIKEMKTTPSS